MKKCCKCRIVKSKKLFYTSPYSADGLQVQCSLCNSVKNKNKIFKNGRYLSKPDKRASLLLKAGGKFREKDIIDLLVKQKEKCVYCETIFYPDGRPIYDVTGKKFHVDHIMPVKLGGSNHPENLQLLCAKCNLAKSSIHPDVYENKIAYVRAVK